MTRSDPVQDDGIADPPWGDELTPFTEVCGGRYVLLQELARGDLSIVYRAKVTGGGEPIAFKVLQPRLLGHDPQKRRFRREAEVLRRIEHPNIVRLLDHGSIEDDRPFIALELLNGQTLADALADGVKMEPERVCRICRQIARALRAMHAVTLIHRDLQPANIVLIGPKDGERVKLVDFSDVGDVSAPVRRVRPRARGRSTGNVVDGPNYRAPEQLRKRPPHPSMDIYALGVMMYQMLAGEHPFGELVEGSTPKMGPQTIRSKVFDAPEELLGLIADCIEAEPRERPASIDVVLERLDKALLWMGVVPHELEEGAGDEDARTQIWPAARPVETDAPEVSSEPSEPTAASGAADDAPHSFRGGEPGAESTVDDPGAETVGSEGAGTAVGAVATNAAATSAAATNASATNASATATNAAATNASATATNASATNASATNASATNASAVDAANRIEAVADRMHDERHASEGDPSEDDPSQADPSEDDLSEDEGPATDAVQDDTTVDEDGRPWSPDDGFDERRERGAPTGPRFVVDTVAWTKQQPSAGGATRARKRTVGSRREASTREPSGDDHRASQTHVRQRTGSRPPVTASADALSRWLLPVFLGILGLLAYAVWVVWTQ